jgi:hypothetical protein
MWGDERIGGETKFSYSPGSCTGRLFSHISQQYPVRIAHVPRRAQTGDAPSSSSGPPARRTTYNDRQKLITLDTMEIGAFVV